MTTPIGNPSTSPLIHPHLLEGAGGPHAKLDSTGPNEVNKWLLDCGLPDSPSSSAVTNTIPMRNSFAERPSAQDSTTPLQTTVQGWSDASVQKNDPLSQGPHANTGPGSFRGLTAQEMLLDPGLPRSRTPSPPARERTSTQPPKEKSTDT